MPQLRYRLTKYNQINGTVQTKTPIKIEANNPKTEALTTHIVMIENPIPTEISARTTNEIKFSVFLSSNNKGMSQTQPKNPSGNHEKLGTDKPSNKPLITHDKYPCEFFILGRYSPTHAQILANYDNYPVSIIDDSIRDWRSL